MKWLILGLLLLLPVVSAQVTPELITGTPIEGFVFTENPQEFQFKIINFPEFPKCTIFVDKAPIKSYYDVENSVTRRFNLELAPGKHEWFVTCKSESSDLSSPTKSFSVDASVNKRSSVEKFYVGGGQKRWIYTVNLPLDGEDEVIIEDVQGNDDVDLAWHIGEEIEERLELQFYAPIEDHSKKTWYAQYKMVRALTGFTRISLLNMILRGMINLK